MRILVTGSRDWNDDVLVGEVLTYYLARSYKCGPLIVVHGACPEGVDVMADSWVTYSGSLALLGRAFAEPHPADWGSYGKAAGMKRNAEMAALGADVCLAFIRDCSKDCGRLEIHGSHGATDCAERAQRKGIRTRIFRQDMGGQNIGEAA